MSNTKNNHKVLTTVLSEVQSGGQAYQKYNLHGMHLPCSLDNEYVAKHLLSRDITVIHHGYWMPSSLLGVSICSVCGESSKTPNTFNKYFKFCPVCGALMDAKE